jgi:DNA-binding transcriptional regulator YhcF (GntR family)
MKFDLDKELKVPIYRQLINLILKKIDDGGLIKGAQLPSINQLCMEYNISKETVIKAFYHLQERGVVKAVHGIGFFIASDIVNQENRIFVLFDTFSSYKEKLYSAIKEAFGDKAYIDIYFHHFNPKVFKQLLTDAVGNYTSYIVLPFDNPNITQMLDIIPFDKMILLDRKPVFYKNKFQGIYQDFNKDIYHALSMAKANSGKYDKLVLVFRDTITIVPQELKEGFERYCNDFNLQFEVITTPLKVANLELSTAYIVIDDEDLVFIVDAAHLKKLAIGKDIGIISYNDTSLKRVVGNGISVITTDFIIMGQDAANMILTAKKYCKTNTASFIDRGSF